MLGILRKLEDPMRFDRNTSVVFHQSTILLQYYKLCIDS